MKKTPAQLNGAGKLQLGLVAVTFGGYRVQSCTLSRYGFELRVVAMSRGYNDRSRQRVSLLVRNLPLDAR